MIFSLSGSYCSNNESPSNTQTDSPHSRSHWRVEFTIQT
jgi:hypothetical protein